MQLHRPQVGVDAQLLAKPQQPLLRPHLRIGRRPLRSADRAEQNRIRIQAALSACQRAGGRRWRRWRRRQRQTRSVVNSCPKRPATAARHRSPSATTSGPIPSPPRTAICAFIPAAAARTLQSAPGGPTGSPTHPPRSAGSSARTPREEISRARRSATRASCPRRRS